MWRELDPDDLMNALTQPERDLFGTGSQAIGFPDRLEQILDWVVSRIRGKVAANLANSDNMGPELTIPEELYGAAIQIARFDFLTAFPQGRLFIDEPRERSYMDAIKQLDDAALGTLLVEPAGVVQFATNPAAFGSRDDFLNDRSKPFNRNVIDFMFNH